MKFKLSFLLMATMIAIGAGAKEPHFFQKGVLVKMDSAECGVDTRGAELADHTKAQQMLCQQYLLRGKRLDYEIRPRDQKHPAILPIGETAEFRIDKDRMRLRIPGMDGKEREFIVVAISQREAANDAKDPVTAQK